MTLPHHTSALEENCDKQDFKRHTVYIQWVSKDGREGPVTERKELVLVTVGIPHLDQPHQPAVIAPCIM